MISLRYEELLSKSFKAVWKYKVVWLFGILLAIFSGPLKVMLNIAYGFSGPGRDMIALTERILSWVWVDGQRLKSYMIAAAILVSLHSLISIFLYPLLSGSLIGLVTSTGEDTKPKAQAGLSVGLRKSLPILGESLLLAVPYLIAVFLIAATGAAMLALAILSKSAMPPHTLALAIAFGVLAVTALAVAWIRISIIDSLARRFIVIEGEGAVASIKRAAALFKKHVGQTLLAWLMLIAIGTGVSAAYFMFIVVSGILVVRAAATSLTEGLLVAAAAFTLLIIFSGFTKAFSSAFWTYFFMALQKRDAGRELSIEETHEGDYHIDEELTCPKIQVNSTSAQRRSETSRI